MAIVRTERMLILGYVRGLAAVILLFTGAAANFPRVRADWRWLSSGQSVPELITQEDAAFRSLTAWLPPRGKIGYLQPADWPGANAIRRFYLAQYSLTPRVVVLGVGPEFLIAVPEAVVKHEPGPETAEDSRPRGYVLFRRFDNGIRLFRRFE